jgi:hypothetical protein
LLYVNSKNTVHGTLSACVVDWAAGMAIASTGLDVTGVSTDLSVSYLSKAQLGDILEIEGKILKIGKTLAFTTITIGERMVGRTVDIVHGSHTKLIRCRYIGESLRSETGNLQYLSLSLEHYESRRNIENIVLLNRSHVFQ